MIFFFLSLFTLLIVDGAVNPPLDMSWRYIELPIGVGMIGLIAFAVLYMIGAPIYNRIKKKNIITEKKDDLGELKEPF